jgi:hypothetical protein
MFKRLVDQGMTNIVEALGGAPPVVRQPFPHFSPLAGLPSTGWCWEAECLSGRTSLSVHAPDTATLFPSSGGRCLGWCTHPAPPYGSSTCFLRAVTL